MGDKFSPPSGPPPYSTNPPPPGFYSPPPQPPHQTPTVTSVTITSPTYHGTCPVCHKGNFHSGFTGCGWLLAICCFPCGIICCFCMRKKRCSHCGFSAS